MNAKLLSLSLLMLSACNNAASVPPADISRVDTLPPIRTALECLPNEGALVAAHRGTAEGYLEPENSISALERLIADGILMAEIDIAAIKDGTPVIFHDGVWDYHTDQTGPVVATSAADFARLRLKDTNERVTVEPVPTLAAMLDAAKGRIYLELDFKTSSDMDTTLQMVRDREMTDQVLLIATDDAEAEAFMPYAGEFLMSLPRAPQSGATNSKQGVWIGGRWRDGGEAEIEGANYVIGAQWKKDAAQLPKAARALDILVTDQAQRYDTAAGLSDPAAFRACLNAG